MTPMIKPLTWMTVGPNKLQSNEWPFYTINKLHGGWACGDRFYGHDGPELAQSAAQADYAARITAALDPAWMARMDALVTAADGLAEAGDLIRTRCGPLAPDGKAWDAALTTFRAAKEALG